MIANEQNFPVVLFISDGSNITLCVFLPFQILCNLCTPQSIYRSTYQQIYRLICQLTYLGQYIGRYISRVLADMSTDTVKFRKQAPGPIFFKGPFRGAYFWRGSSMEGSLHLQIDWTSLIVRSKFTVFALFYFVFEGNFPSTSPQGAYIWRGNLTERFLHHRFGGLISGGAYTWRGLFSEFYGISTEGCTNYTRSNPLLNKL